MLVLKGLVGLHRTYGLFMLRYDRTQHNSVKQLSLNLKNEWVTKNIFWHQICNLLFKYESPRANFHSWNAKSVHFINEYQDTDFSTWNLRYFIFHIKKTCTDFLDLNMEPSIFHIGKYGCYYFQIKYVVFDISLLKI